MKIFITGVSSGIGKELVAQLTKSGHRVWGIARREELLRELQKSAGDSFSYSVADVVKREDMNRVLGDMQSKDFVPDAVIFNAGVLKNDSDPDFSDASFNEMMEVNCGSVAMWCVAMIPAFKSAGTEYLAISSMSAFRPSNMSAGYAASKAALSMLFRGLRLRYAKENIAFKLVYFGPIATDMVPAWKEKGVVKKLLVASPASTAAFIVKNTLTKSVQRDFYFPFASTLMFSVMRMIPDSWFIRLSAYAKK